MFISLLMVLAVDATAASKMDRVLPHYIQIQTALAADKIKGVKFSADKIAKLSDGEVKAAAVRLAAAADIQAMREEFKVLSQPVVAWAKQAKPKDHAIVYCSMAPGRWLQKRGSIANPYHGSEMLECGEIEEKF